jgi:hypothetical protein
MTVRLDRLRIRGHLAGTRRSHLVAIVALAFVLEVGAGVGMAYVAGFHEVRAALSRFSAIWLLALIGALAISFVGYHFVYRDLYAIDGGPDLSPRQMRAVVAAGFGGFLARGGGALDEYAMKGAGTDERDAKVRVAALAGLEHGILALWGCAAAISLLLAGIDVPPHDFTIPWAVLPVPGFLIAFWAAGRYRERFRVPHGWRSKAGVFLDCIFLIRRMFHHPWKHAAALAGMTLFWAADLFSGWAGLAMFGFAMNVGQFVVGFGTGMVFTRRTGPLAGAGILTVVLSVTLWYSGAPFGPAVAGVFAYRFLALLMPMPFSLAALGTIREVGEPDTPHAEGEADAPTNEPALRRRPA